MLTEHEMFGTDTGITVGRARGGSSVRMLRHTLGREGPKGREGSWVTWPLHRLAGDTFSPPHTVARASTGSSWEAAAMEGRCGRGSGWLPTPEVGVRAHGDRFRKFQAPLAPPPCLGTSHQCPSTGQWNFSRVLSFHETDLLFFLLYTPLDKEHGLQSLKSCLFTSCLSTLCATFFCISVVLLILKLGIIMLPF